MKRNLLIVLGLVLLVGTGYVGAGDGEHHGPPPPQDARLDFLKSLEGRWTGKSEGMPDGMFEFRVTAGGHAVEEREMIGTPMEMLTVYHMEGKDLVATHYCMLGNQPGVTAAKKLVDNALTFACNGKPGNARSHDDAHIHGWSIGVEADGRLRYSGKLLEQGQVKETPEFLLTRQQTTAQR